MKKILFVIYSLGYGGAERSLINLLNELPQDRYQADVLLFHRCGDFLQQVPNWVRVLDTPKGTKQLYGPVKNAGMYLPVKIAATAYARLKRRGKKAQSALRWKKVYRKMMGSLPEKYDVAIAYVGSEVMYFVHDCVQAERKLVWIHNDYRTAGYSKPDDEPYLQNMDGIVSVSEGCVETLKQEFPELQEKIHYVENITSSASVRAMAGAFMPPEYQDGQNIILSIGRLMPQKGFDIAIQTAALLKKRGVSFQWYVAGDGYLRNELEKQIEKLEVQDCFMLLGTRNNPYPYIRHCTLLVQSSRYEGKSVVLDETKILCKPIVATGYPTAGDQINDGKEGIITGMTPESLADGIERLLNDPELRRQMGCYMEQNEYGNQSEVEKYVKLIG